MTLWHPHTEPPKPIEPILISFLSKGDYPLFVLKNGIFIKNKAGKIECENKRIPMNLTEYYWAYESELTEELNSLDIVKEAKGRCKNTIDLFD